MNDKILWWHPRPILIGRYWFVAYRTTFEEKGPPRLLGYRTWRDARKSIKGIKEAS